LDLRNGIPSHDTFGRVFFLIEPEEFKQCFLSWIKEVSKITEGEIVAIDGKTLRGSYDKKSNKSAIHMISAWADANSLVLGQIKVDDKSNEITAIPKLIEILELKGCIVTIDAMGCQKKIAKKIIDKGADYILALKGNQGKLFEETINFFHDAEAINFDGIKQESYMTEDNNHGRKEIREYRLVTDISWLNNKEEWEGLKSIGTVISKRIIADKETIERRYYISSLTSEVERFADATRKHWGIENKLHWVLDVQLREDDCRIRKGNGAENFAILRHVALNL
jgi:predicted transposase YbfD/YdcC